MFLFETVGRERRDGRSAARENPERRSDHSSAHHCGERLLEIGQRRPYPRHRLDGHARGVGAFEIDHDLSQAEQAHRQRHEADPVEEHVETHGQPVLAGQDVGADDAEENAEHDHAHGFEHRTMREYDRGHQSEQHHGNVVRRLKQ
jgi:hypothetical protein